MAKITDTAAPALDASTCPAWAEHLQSVGRVHETCGELIPGGGYTPEQLLRYFHTELVQPPNSFDGYHETDEEKDLHAKRERARQAAEDAVFRAYELRTVGERSHWFDAAAAKRGITLDAQVEQAIIEREKLIEAERAILLEINRLAMIRTAKASRALYLESYPEPDPSMLDRIVTGIRGR
jgi:hypothetical protein